LAAHTDPAYSADAAEFSKGFSPLICVIETTTKQVL